MPSRGRRAGTHQARRTWTASDESWATETNAAAQPRRKQAAPPSTPTTLTTPRRPGRIAGRRRPSLNGCRASAAHRRAIETGSAAPPASASKPRAPTCPTAKQPRARVAREAAGLQPREPRLPPSSPTTAAVAAAAVAARVADGVDLPRATPRDITLGPHGAADRPGADDALRGDRRDQPVRRGPGGLRGVPPVARRAALPVSCFVLAARGRRAAAPDARRAGGLFACCVVFFFEVPSRPSRLRPIAQPTAFHGSSAQPTAQPTVGAHGRADRCDESPRRVGATVAPRARRRRARTPSTRASQARRPSPSSTR